MVKGRITVSLVIDIEGVDGEDISDQDVSDAREATHRAIRNRLFGEGFLPDHVAVDEYSLTVI